MYTHTHIHTYTHTYIHTYIHTHIHTYTHTHTKTQKHIHTAAASFITSLYNGIKSSSYIAGTMLLCRSNKYHNATASNNTTLCKVMLFCTSLASAR
jgi:hypothetical protein